MAVFKYKNRNVWYKVIGDGKPLILLHGNTVSSKMFDYVMDLYAPSFQVIVMDFLGHGESDRLDIFETNFWYDQGKQVVALIDHLDLQDVFLLGTSGGALAALNAGLIAPDKIKKIVADSFEGEEMTKEEVEYIKKERTESKTNKDAQGFWTYNHGHDWEKIVDLDTEMVERHFKKINRLFCNDLSELKVNTLMMGSREDAYVDDIDKVYQNIANKNHRVAYHIFDIGHHPAIISNKELFFNHVCDYLLR